MAAGTGVTYKNGHLQVIQASFTLDAGSLATETNEDQTVAIGGCRVGDAVIVSPRAALLDGVIIANPHVSADGTVTFTLENNSGTTRNLASQVFDVTVLRGLAGGAFA